MKKILWVVIPIVLSGALAATYVFFTAVGSFSQEGKAPKDQAQFTNISQATPEIEHLTEPHAILVLDVSGSMQSSDPNFDQIEATKKFYKLFSELSQEILDQNDQAHVAVMLFGSVPQFIDWTGNQSIWLPVTTEDEAQRRFEGAIEALLRKQGVDSRDGQDTDYYNAIKALDKSLDNLKTPPLILFFTDGFCEVHPILNPLFDRETIAQRWPSHLSTYDLASALRNQTEGLYVDPKQSQSIYNRNRIEPIVRKIEGLDKEQLNREIVYPAINQLLDKINNRPFTLEGSKKSVGLFWAPIVLDISRSVEDSLFFANVLATEANELTQRWPFRNQILYCDKASQLTGGFVRILSSWLNLREIPINSDQVRIPPKTLAYAYLFKTDRKVGRLQLHSESGQGSIDVECGDSTYWAGVGRSVDRFTILSQGANIIEGTLYIRPKFHWGLTYPNGLVTGYNQSLAQIEIDLRSFASKERVSALNECDQLPESITGELFDATGTRLESFTLVLVAPADKTDDEQTAIGPAYIGQCQTEQLRDGMVTLKVDLRPIQESRCGYLVFDEFLVEKIKITPTVQLALFLENGQPLNGGISLDDNIPVANKLARTISGWFE